MHPLFLPTFSLWLTTTAFTLIHIPKSSCQDQQYVACGVPYECGNISFIYPFWGGNRSNCGYPGFEVSCQGNVPRITIEPVTYRILAPVNTASHSLTLAREDLWNDSCPRFLHNTSLNFNIFSYSSNIANITLSYNCTTPSNLPQQQKQFVCPGNSTTTNTTSFFSTSNVVNRIPNLVTCSDSITVPINQGALQNLTSTAALRDALVAGFPLQYEANNSICTECKQSGGRCGYNTSFNSFVCYCSDRPYDSVCTQNGGGMCSSIKSCQ